MVRLDPQYQLVFGAGGELLSTSRPRRLEPPGRRAVAPRPGTRQLPGRQPGQVRALPPLPRIAVPRLAGPALAPDAEAAPQLRPWRSLDARAGALLQRPAHPAGVLVPVEVPGHVAVQLPEPVLDPLVPRIRVRRLPPDRRLRRGLRGDGPGGRASWASTIRLGEAGARRSCSTAGGPSACATDAGEHRADALRDQRRLRPRHDAARARPPAAGAGPTAKIAHEEVLLLDLHAVPRDRGPLRRPAAPHIYIAADYERNLDDIENRHVLSDDPSFYVQNACVTDPTLAPRGHEHALRPRAGHAPAPERRLEPGAGSASGRWRSAQLAKVGHRRTSSGGSASSRSSRRPTGTSGYEIHRGRDVQPAPTASARCSTCGRATASRTSTASTSSAAAPTPAAGCR